MTILMRNCKTLNTIHVVGCSFVRYTKCRDTYSIETIDTIPIASDMWLFEHDPISCFEHDSSVMFALSAEVWYPLAACDNDSMFGINTHYVLMSGDGIKISDDLKEGGDTP